MARPVKEGFEYFSLDTDFTQNIKVRRICKACGPHSISVLISLLCNIYRERGYYIGWDNDMPFLIADEVGISEGSVSEVIRKAIQVGFFDEEMASNEQILTSRDIQERYTRICVEAKRRRWGIQKRFSLMESTAKAPHSEPPIGEDMPAKEEPKSLELLPEKTPVITGNNPEITPVITPNNPPETELLPPIMPQRKVKESKEKKIYDDDVGANDASTRREEVLSGYRPSPSLSIEDIFRTVTDPEGLEYPWLRHVANRHHLSGQALGEHLVEFCKHLKATGVDTKRLKDFKQHFNSWVRIQLSLKQSSANEGDSAYWEKLSQSAKQKLRNDHSPKT